MIGLIRQRDVISGILLVVMGLAVASYAQANYDIGTLRFVGPGAFPLGAGLLLALLGLLLALAGLRDLASPAAIDWEDLGRVVLGLIAFAVLIRPFGVVVAVAALTAISMVTRDRSTWRQALVVTVILSALSIALFQYGLGLRVAAIDWPF